MSETERIVLCLLITGASRGIGKAVAEGFMSEKYRVVVSARTAAPLDEMVACAR